MKSIVELINENIRLNESKKFEVDEILEYLDKVEKWNSAKNIKKLMGEYISDDEIAKLSSNHWDVCADIVDRVVEVTRSFLNGAMGVIGVDELSNTIADALEDENFVDNVNDDDDDCDWDIDEIFNLFNTVSTKVCRKSWLN